MTYSPAPADLGAIPTEILGAAAARRSDLASESVLATWALLSLGESVLDLHPDDWARLVAGLGVAEGNAWVERYYADVMSATGLPAPSIGRTPAVCRMGWSDDHRCEVPVRHDPPTLQSETGTGGSPAGSASGVASVTRFAELCMFVMTPGSDRSARPARRAHLSGSPPAKPAVSGISP